MKIQEQCAVSKIVKKNQKNPSQTGQLFLLKLPEAMKCLALQAL